MKNINQFRRCNKISVLSTAVKKEISCGKHLNIEQGPNQILKCSQNKYLGIYITAKYKPNELQLKMFL